MYNSVCRRLSFLLCECILMFEHVYHPRNPNGCGELVSAKHNLTTNRPLPSRNVILKRLLNKQQQAQMLNTVNMNAAVTTTMGSSDMRES